MNREQIPLFCLIESCPDSFAGLEDEPAPAVWPQSKTLGLSPEQIAWRRAGLGGSDANVILSGDEAAIFDLWREKRGEKTPVDLSDKLPVVLGQWTEEFNRQWFERVQGRNVSARGMQLACPANNWRRCTLDGMIWPENAIWEAKHTNAFARSDEVLERYMPQLQHNMAVAGCERAVLSVIFGNHKFEVFEVAADWLYQQDLLAAEQAFWISICDGTEPIVSKALPTPRPIGTREICLEGNNHWASAAADWLEYRAAAKLHAAACVDLKSLVEPDVTRAFGHGLEARRSRSGAISIRELVQ